MANFETLEKYLKRTGQTEAEIMGGSAAYGIYGVLELVDEAEKKQKKLIFYYETDEDMKMDNLTHKFE